jgi:hypothetical protein
VTIGDGPSPTRGSFRSVDREESSGSHRVNLIIRGGGGVVAWPAWAELRGGKVEWQICLSAPEAEIFSRRKRDHFLGFLKVFWKSSAEVQKRHALTINVGQLPSADTT